MIYDAHTIIGLSVLAPSLLTYMQVLFTLIQLWPDPAKLGSITSTAL